MWAQRGRAGGTEKSSDIDTPCVKELAEEWGPAAQHRALGDDLEGWDWRGHGELQEGGDLCTHRPIRFIVQQKRTQRGKAIILQMLKN